MLLPPFIRKLKMLPVYAGLDLFSFCWPRMEKDTFAVFLSISCHYAFVQMHLYLFMPPLLFLSLFPLPCYGPKKREQVCAGPVLYKPVLFSGRVIKKATLNRTRLREEKGQI